MKEFVESRAEMEQFLREEDLGLLCCSRDGAPYAVPINYAYVDGKILLHCNHAGLKMDVIAKNSRVCFVVARQEGPVKPHAPGQQCHVPSTSVICHGTARVVRDEAERAEALNAFLRRYRPAAEPLAPEDVRGCACIEVAIEEMTGRREHQKRQVLSWRWRFR